MKKLLSLIVTLAVCISFYGCSDENSSSEGSADISSQSGVQSEGLTEDEKKSAAEKGISEDRYCTDAAKITEIVMPLFDKYYGGITSLDYDMHASVFTDFYREALEKEIKDYGQTSEEYIKQILDTVSESYGENFYMFASVDSVSQINDESLKSFEEFILEDFGEEVTVEDLYTIYYFEIARGRDNKTTLPREILLMKIDNQYYLYSE